jgi:hypothetical protein
MRDVWVMETVGTPLDINRDNTCFYSVPKRKRNLDGGNSQDPGGLETKATNMEVMKSMMCPAWATGTNSRK